MPNFDLRGFTLKEHYFDYPSEFHGIHHTYRVMLYCLKLGNILGYHRETKLAFCAAYIHDMARKHYGKCMEHGAWAAELKLPLFNELFFSIGIKAEELQEIKIAVTNHCLHKELLIHDPYYITTAILKDSDALDRIRLNEPVKYLIFRESAGLIDFAETLYFNTHNISKPTFQDVLNVG